MCPASADNCMGKWDILDWTIARLKFRFNWVSYICLVLSWNWGQLLWNLSVNNHGCGGLGPLRGYCLAFWTSLLQVVDQSSIFICGWPFSICIFSLSIYNSFFPGKCEFHDHRKCTFIPHKYYYRLPFSTQLPESNLCPVSLNIFMGVSSSDCRKLMRMKSVG